MDSELEHLVKEWLRLDQNESTRKEIHELYSQGSIAELNRRLRKRIEFGTAGLRGRMEAGWSRMNDLIVVQTSQGLCSYVLKNIPNAKEKGVVIGHDHRHHSTDWAELAAMTFLNQGIKVYLHRGLIHTPLVPFSVHELQAACGIMITASHNPKDDNGYKVYWENAVQIISPHDQGITEEIMNNLESPRWDRSVVNTSNICLDVTGDMKKSYFAYLSTLRLSRNLTDEGPAKFVNTSMHGVSHPFAVKAFEVFNLPAFMSVPEQRDPDPDFRTVKFPNPEEKGALDLAMAYADSVGAEYVLAQDPDADRFIAAEKYDETSKGAFNNILSSDAPKRSWRIFTGDQLGALFAYRQMNAFKAAEKPLDKLAMVASTVSSKMLEAMAAKEGFKFVECLTGFKYIGNTALDLVQQGYEVPFGYEEAIGFMFGNSVRDKDGIAASVCFAEMVMDLRAQGKTVSRLLHELYERYGHFKTSNGYFICNDPPTIKRIFGKLRGISEDSNKSYNPALSSYPTYLGPLVITRVVDLITGFDSGNAPSYKTTLPLSSGEMIQFRAELEGGGIKICLTIRTSGTEPKIKYYLEGSGPSEADVDALLPVIVGELSATWMEAEKNGLQTS